MKNGAYALMAAGVLMMSWATDSMAFSGTIGPNRGNNDPCRISGINPQSELGKRCAASANSAKPVTTGSASGSTTKTTSGATSGSSEHASVRGTINGGGDFIAPQIKTPVHKPRSVAPKARQ